MDCYDGNPESHSYARTKKDLVHFANGMSMVYIDMSPELIGEDRSENDERRIGRRGNTSMPDFVADVFLMLWKYGGR